MVHFTKQYSDFRAAYEVTSISKGIREVLWVHTQPLNIDIKMILWYRFGDVAAFGF